MKLADAVQRALWRRMAEGTFRKRDLVPIAIEAGHPRATAHRAVDRFVLDVRAKGAIYFTGERQTGYWTLLAPEEWTGAPISARVEPPVLQSPVASGPYDPAPEIEGPNNGLTEAFAEHLWHDLGAGDRSYALKSLPIMEQRAWREAADRGLKALFDLGFVGPAGPPRERYAGWSYKWLYEASTWEICDEEGGYVAMVSNDRDVPLFLAAPDMAWAIRDLLDRYERHGAVRRSDIDALQEAFPQSVRDALPPSDEARA